MPSILGARGIQTGYDGVQILWGADLEVSQGQVVVLLGPNGAGKTTLLRAIMGLLPLWKGSVMLGDQDVSAHPTHARVRSGMAFMSELGVFPDLNVVDNLRMGGHFLARGEVQPRLEEMYALFPDLARLRKSAGGSLSGGQRKMLGVAKTLMSKPRLLVMDEPSAGLSPKYVKEVIGILNKAHDQGLSLLIAEQNVLFLEQADYGYVMEGGRVVAQGSPTELAASDVIRRAYFGLAGDSRAAPAPAPNDPPGN
jgi:branched-chain amino acid transport system ATP-binding protein